MLRRIELYLDGELDDAITVEIEEHLVLCGPCTDRSDFQRTLKAMIRSRCGCDDVPPHVVDRIERAIRSHPPRA